MKYKGKYTFYRYLLFENFSDSVLYSLAGAKKQQHKLI